VLAIRRQYQLLGARRARLLLEDAPALAGQRLPSERTIHRAWGAAGLVVARSPRDTPPASPPLPAEPTDPHAVWQIDHQDGITVAGVDTPVVLQDVRAPAVGLIVGADLFASRGGAHAVPIDAVLDALRRGFLAFGTPRAISVDGGVHFLGRPQRAFPSRFELFCAGLGIAVVPIRPGRPTDHGAVERQHRTLDAILAGPPVADLAAAQTRRDAHVTALNTRFRSRARHCRGQPPLTAHPTAHHSGRAYDPATEWHTFDLAAVDRVLAAWRWVRKVSPTGQISFADHNRSVGRALAGTYVALRFDPADRQVVVFTPSATPDTLGPVLTRFACPAFAKAAIIGRSQIAPIPPPAGDTAVAVTRLHPCDT
jgi:transposase InsO family protein